MTRTTYETDPREYALELIENGLVTADHMVLVLLKYMSHDDVRDALHCNELSPMFLYDEENEE